MAAIFGAERRRHLLARDLPFHHVSLVRGPTVGVTNPFSMTTDEGQGSKY